MADKEQDNNDNKWNIPEGEFCVVGKVYADADKADELEAIYTELSRHATSGNEPDTISYCISRDPDDRTVFHFFERYASREAFEAHNAHPLCKRLMTEPGLMKNVEAKFLKPLVGMGTKR
ncbi:hypothetical protein F5Y17DRAFT_431646 [Xylariaceae sp. FL0594]|nr:hypothetical protein F5Y17DRAFT_431646 [Xylariaceae sp. FL0594]